MQFLNRTKINAIRHVLAVPGRMANAEYLNGRVNVNDVALSYSIAGEKQLKTSSWLQQYFSSEIGTKNVVHELFASVRKTVTQV